MLSRHREAPYTLVYRPINIIKLFESHRSLLLTTRASIFLQWFLVAISQHNLFCEKVNFYSSQNYAIDKLVTTTNGSNSQIKVFIFFTINFVLKQFLLLVHWMEILSTCATYMLCCICACVSALERISSEVEHCFVSLQRRYIYNLFCGKTALRKHLKHIICKM